MTQINYNYIVKFECKYGKPFCNFATLSIVQFLFLQCLDGKVLQALLNIEDSVARDSHDCVIDWFCDIYPERNQLKANFIDVLLDSEYKKLT